MSFTFSNGLAAIRVQRYGLFLRKANFCLNIFSKKVGNSKVKGEGEGVFVKIIGRYLTLHYCSFWRKNKVGKREDTPLGQRE